MSRFVGLMAVAAFAALVVSGDIQWDVQQNFCKTDELNAVAREICPAVDPKATTTGPIDRLNGSTLHNECCLKKCSPKFIKSVVCPQKAIEHKAGTVSLRKACKEAYLLSFIPFVSAPIVNWLYASCFVNQLNNKEIEDAQFKKSKA